MTLPTRAVLRDRVSHRFLSHTADLRLEVMAPSLDELFAEALVGFTEAMTEVESVSEETSWTVETEAADLGGLLVAWLEELLFYYDARGLLPRRAVVRVAGEEGSYRLAATVHGEPYDPERHEIKVLLKAITYHGLVVEQVEGGEWRAEVIFDI